MSSYDIAVAVSGGLDSLMAMCLLKDAGHKLLAVHGVFVPGSPTRFDGLRRSCDSLDIPLEIVDLSAAFAQQVIEPFATAYALGATPNPCVTCNREIKFGLLLEAALGFGAQRLATGHYARLEYFHSPQGEYLTLGRAADAGKDQAYFLGLVPSESLQRTEFPLADYRKPDLRAEAERRGLFVPESRESQEICFIPNDDYRAFLLAKGIAAKSSGPIILCNGRQIGEHCGLWQYTEGQRRGLGVAHSEPLMREYTTSPGYEVAVGRRTLQFNNTNRLVKSDNWDIGLQKTGYISEAGRCLVMQAQVAGRKLIMVFLDSAGKFSRIADAERVRHWLEGNGGSTSTAMLGRIKG